MRQPPKGMPARLRRGVAAVAAVAALLGSGCDAAQVDQNRRGVHSSEAPAGVNDAWAVQRMPVRLSGRLQMVREPGVTLIGGERDAGLERACLLAARAVREVKRALPVRLPMVTVVVPSDAEAASRWAGSTTQELDHFAAVTATTDGSDNPNVPVQVVLNPPVFDSLDRRAARFVLAHEMTHAATGATTSPMPLWVAEGFADYVALRNTTLPVTLTAGKILARVDRVGTPHTLPTPADFAPSARGLSRTYEAAWLAFRMLAAEYGHAATVQFYLSVRDGVSLPRALDRAFDLGVPALTNSWRSYLIGLAKAA